MHEYPILFLSERPQLGLLFVKIINYDRLYTSTIHVCRSITTTINIIIVKLIITDFYSIKNLSKEYNFDFANNHKFTVIC